MSHRGFNFAGLLFVAVLGPFALIVVLIAALNTPYRLALSALDAWITGVWQWR